MEKSRLGIIASSAAAVILLGGLAATPAAAASTFTAQNTSARASADITTQNGTSYVGGGLWSYGVTSTEVFSAYSNNIFKHSSTARDGAGRQTRITKNAGTVSYAHRAKTTRDNVAFWNIY